MSPCASCERLPDAFGANCFFSQDLGFLFYSTLEEIPTTQVNQRTRASTQRAVRTPQLCSECQITDDSWTGRSCHHSNV